MEEKTEFKVGDVVTLASGGPAMTITKFAYGADACRCEWFADGEYKEKFLPTDALRKHKPEQQTDIRPNE